LALTSPTGGGRSVGIVRVRTKATEFSLLVLYITSATTFPLPPLTVRLTDRLPWSLDDLWSLLSKAAVYRLKAKCGEPHCLITRWINMSFQTLVATYQITRCHKQRANRKTYRHIRNSNIMPEHRKDGCDKCKACSFPQNVTRRQQLHYSAG